MYASFQADASQGPQAVRFTSFVCWLVCAFCLVAGVPAWAQTDILGKFQYKDERRFEYFIKDGKLFNRITYLKDNADADGQPLLDTKNPDPKLRNRPRVGIISAQNLVYKGHNTWENGTAYDPTSGRSYRVRLRLTDPNTIEFTAYVFGVPFTATQNRVEE